MWTELFDGDTTACNIRIDDAEIREVFCNWIIEGDKCSIF